MKRTCGYNTGSVDPNLSTSHQGSHKAFSKCTAFYFVLAVKCQQELIVLYARKYLTSKNLSNSGLSRFDKIKVDELLRVPKCIFIQLGTFCLHGT